MPKCETIVTAFFSIDIAHYHTIPGSDIPTSVNSGLCEGAKVITAVEKNSGLQVPYKESPRRAGDPPVLVAKADKAKQVLGWQAQHSDLDNIVKTAWAWSKKQQSK